MLSALRLGVLGLFLSLAFGCHSIRVHTDWDPEISFMSLSRFAWLEPPEIEGANPFADNSLLRKRLRGALHEALAERGYRKVETPEEVNFLVTYSVILDERIRVDGSYSTGYGGYGRHGFGHAYSNSRVRNYQESTLIIDLLDPKSQDLIWRGWGSGVVATRDRDRDGRRLNSGVRQILNAFPPDSPGSEQR
ncbi:MAG: DUF4136 domain-containing protein [Myxococcota bacterium]